MFEGSSVLTLDDKGRLLIPTRHRDVLQQQFTGKLTLTRKPPGDASVRPSLCLLVYPHSAWEEKRAEIEKFPSSADFWKQMLIGNAQTVEIDRAGRVLVAPELRAAALLTRDVRLVGMGGYFELWDVEEHQRFEAENMSKGRPACLEHFSF